MKSERGITIIETTVILSVLFILAGAMSPIVSESVTTARTVKARNDAAMIAMGLVNLQKDIGADLLGLGAALAGASSGMPEVLASAGEAPATEDPETASDGRGPGALRPLLGGRGRGAGDDSSTLAGRRRWHEASQQSMEDHLYTNRRGYRYRRPGEPGGWNGPYVSAHLTGDPWGNQYLINSRWLDGGTTTADSEGRPRRAVFVVSAGANGLLETPYEQTVVDAQAFGDDIAVRIQ